jgi:hypothetical protein
VDFGVLQSNEKMVHVDPRWKTWLKNYQFCPSCVSSSPPARWIKSTQQYAYVWTSVFLNRLGNAVKFLPRWTGTFKTTYNRTMRFFSSSSAKRAEILVDGNKWTEKRYMND